MPQDRTQPCDPSDGTISGPIPSEVISRFRAAEWKVQADALPELTKIAIAVKKRRPYSPEENKALLQQLHTLAPLFATFIADLRSTLVREVCSSICALSDILGAPFVAQIDVLVIPALLKRTCTSKAVIRDAAKEAAVALFKNGLSAISNPVALLLRNTIRDRKAAPGMRQAASHFVGMFLVDPRSAPAPSILSALEESISAGVEDPDEFVRSQSRGNWVRLAALDEPTAAALLDRISSHVVLQLEEAFEDEFGRPISSGEETLTVTLPLTAFDRPVRAGVADTGPRRAAPVRALTQASSTLPNAASSAIERPKLVHEVTANPVRAPTRPPIPARFSRSTTDVASTNIQSKLTNACNVPSCRSVAPGSVASLPSAKSFNPQSPLAEVPPHLSSRIPVGAISAHKSHVPAPVRSNNGHPPIRANKAPPSTFVASVHPPVRASHGSASVRSLKGSSVPRAFNDSHHSHNKAVCDSVAPHTPDDTQSGGIKYDLSTKQREKDSHSQHEGFRIPPYQNVPAETGSVGDEVYGTLPQKGAFAPETSEGADNTEPTEISHCKSKDNTNFRNSNHVGLSDSPVTSKPATEVSPKSLLSDTESDAESSTQDKVSEDDEECTNREEVPSAFSPKNCNNSLNEPRLSFKIGLNTPQVVDKGTNSCDDENALDLCSSPESVDNLESYRRPSADFGVSGPRTSIINQAKRGISAPDLDTDIESTPVPSVEGTSITELERRFSESVALQNENDKDVRNVFAEDSLVTSTSSHPCTRPVSKEESSPDKDTREEKQSNISSIAKGDTPIVCPQNDICNRFNSMLVPKIPGNSETALSKHPSSDISPDRKTALQSQPATLIANQRDVSAKDLSKQNTTLKTISVKGDTKPRESIVRNPRQNSCITNPSRALQSRRVTSAVGAPLLGKERLKYSNSCQGNLTKGSLSRLPPRHSVAPAGSQIPIPSIPLRTSRVLVRGTASRTSSAKSIVKREVGTDNAKVGIHTQLPNLMEFPGPQTFNTATLNFSTSNNVSRNPSASSMLSGKPRSKTSAKISGAISKNRSKSLNPRSTKSVANIRSTRGLKHTINNVETTVPQRLPGSGRSQIKMNHDVPGVKTDGFRVISNTCMDGPDAKQVKEKNEDTPADKLLLSLKKLRSVTGRIRGDWSCRFERMKDVKESLQSLDRNDLNTFLTEECINVIGDAINDGHHRVVVAALDSLFLLLLRVEGDAESTALQKVFERKIDVIRMVLHLCKDSKEDVRLACQRVLQSFEVQFVPEVQVALLLRAMGIEPVRGSRGHNSARLGHNHSSASRSDTRVIENGCHALVRAYVRADRCEGGFVWSQVMLGTVLVGMATLTKDKHVEIRRGAENVIQAVRKTLPDHAFDLACQKYNVKLTKNGGTSSGDASKRVFEK